MASTNAAKPRRAKISKYYDQWADLPSASSCPGSLVMVGEYNNTEWVSDGTYWKPRGGRQRPFVMAAAVSSTGTTSEVNVWAPTIPAGMLFPMCNVEVGATITKTGTAGNMILRQRYNGAAGTIVGHNLTATAANVGGVSLSRLAAGVASGGNITLTQGNMSNAANGYGVVSTATVGVSHAMASAVTLNFTLQASSAADTININNAFVEICG
jgi:hypothetical protein